ncbi:MAG: hypothetical protein QOG68_13, partial [Solirubrobacteraceae bacterium]|nr:hypothetical protein [Solirubrobacteraceae bacterium]
GYASQVSGRLRFLLPFALLLPALGGCANGDVKEANAYVNAVNRAQTGFAAASEKLLTQISPDQPASRDKVLLDRFYAAVDGFVAKLQAIKPPTRVRALHDRLVAAMVRFGTSLRSAGAAITSKDAARILDGQQQLADATRGVTRAINTTIGAINTALKG